MTASNTVPPWACQGYGFSVEFEGRYAVFTDGTIIRMARFVNGRVRGCLRLLREMALAPFECDEGYQYVSIVVSSGPSKKPVHRIVCAAFYGHVLGMFVNHKNGNKADNWALNLEWITPKGNVVHALDTGLRPVGQDCHMAKLNIQQVRDIRARLSAGESTAAIAPSYPIVTESAIIAISKRKSWRRSE